MVWRNCSCFHFNHHTAAQLLLSSQTQLLHVRVVAGGGAQVPDPWSGWQREGTSMPEGLGQVLQLDARGVADVGWLADVQAGLEKVSSRGHWGEGGGVAGR